MKVKVSTVILSNLSDAQLSVEFGNKSAANDMINFAKWLVLEFPDTNVELQNEELNKLWIDFINK
jgi:hypothetical protein